MIERNWRGRTLDHLAQRAGGAIATVALLAYVLTPGSAVGAPHTEHFTVIQAATGARLDEIGGATTRRERTQRRALEKVDAQLAREALNLRRDVSIARRIDRSLTRRFPADTVFEPVLDDLADALHGETRLRHGAIAAEVDARVAVRPLPRARRAVDAAASLLDRADEAATRRRVLALLRRALGRLRRADRALAAIGLPTVENALQTPVAEIVHAAITESSGLVVLGGAYWTHNDSGGTAVLYRATELTFADAETLALPGATNVDWEDITTLAGDLIVCDVGDNDRTRDDYVLYRARYVPADGAPARLELEATYPFAYPDGRHDCEAVAVIDGQVVLVIKQRDEAETGVYRFDTLTDAGDLPPGTTNVPTKIAGLTLAPGEQATAATVYRGRGPLILLTYFRVLVHDLGTLGAPPTRAVPLSVLATLQAEALCFAGDRLIITNEQRNVFAVHDFLRRE